MWYFLRNVVLYNLNTILNLTTIEAVGKALSLTDTLLVPSPPNGLILYVFPTSLCYQKHSLPKSLSLYSRATDEDCNSNKSDSPETCFWITITIARQILDLTTLDQFKNSLKNVIKYIFEIKMSHLTKFRKNCCTTQLLENEGHHVL